MARPGGGDSVRLRIMATSDLHAHVLAHDYLADAPLADGGLDRTAVLIARARAEAPGALLLDDGDFLNGTPLSDWAAEARAAGCAAPDPVIAAMNRLEYDAAALGNHEFDEPSDGLALALSQARFALLCANAARIDASRPWPVRPWIVLERAVEDARGRERAVRVGVIGLAPPETAGWARGQTGVTLRMRGIVEAARAELPRLRAAGAEIVVALCHAGCEGAGDADGGALALAADGGIDAIVCGHTHGVFPAPQVAAAPGIDPARGRLSGVPAVMPGWRGSHLGVIDLDLEPRPEGGWRVAGARSELRAASDLPAAVRGGLASEPAVARAHAAVLALTRRPLGRTAIRLTTAFAHVGASAALDLLAAAKREAARKLLAGGPHDGLPLLAAAAPIRAGGLDGRGRFTDIPAGDVTMGHLADLCPHPDTLVVLRVTGAELRDWLERAAGRFARVAPGARDAPLLDGAFPSYDFDVVYGVRYAFDLSRPARHDAAGREAPGPGRLAWLERDGRPVAPDDLFAVATKDHRVSGEGLHAPLASAPRIAEGHEPLRATLAERIAGLSPLGPSEPARWGFAPLPGATALFPAPCGAEPPPSLRVERVDRVHCPDDEPHRGSAQAEGGFELFRLRL